MLRAQANLRSNFLLEYTKMGEKRNIPPRSDPGPRARHLGPRTWANLKERNAEPKQRVEHQFLSFFACALSTIIAHTQQGVRWAHPGCLVALGARGGARQRGST